MARHAGRSRAQSNGEVETHVPGAVDVGLRGVHAGEGEHVRAGVQAVGGAARKSLAGSQPCPSSCAAQPREPAANDRLLRSS